MKMRALVTAGMLIVGLAAPCFAFEVPTGANSSGCKLSCHRLAAEHTPIASLNP